jgi:DNA polymerase III sliding clamp (beta) subunit (PCNA family)
MLNFVLFSCSAASVSAVLNNVHVREDGIIESCDNSRLTQYNTGLKGLGQSFLISATAAKALSLYSLNKICVLNNWVHFTDGSVLFSCRLFEDNFPETNNILKMVKPKEVLWPVDIIPVLQRASIFVKSDQQNYITVFTKRSRLYVKARNETSWFDEWVKLEGENEFSIMINPEFLIDILKRTTNCELSDVKLKFATEDWVHVTALVRTPE